MDPLTFPQVFGELGVTNTEQGGIAGGVGCWMHETYIKGGDDLYIPDEVRWCGHPPQHQNALPDKNEPFYCRNCTDLYQEECQTKYDSQIYGYTSTGCWKNGTAILGNTTWVSLIEPPLQNCFISPEQFDPLEWHGNPAGECED